MKKLILILIFFTPIFQVVGQERDTVHEDLVNLSGVEFFKKYSIYSTNKPVTKEDIKVTRLAWSIEHLREIDSALRAQDVPTFTQIVQRPSTESPYYIVGHYQLPTPDHLTPMSYYRISTRQKLVEYQDVFDFGDDRWEKVN